MQLHNSRRLCGRSIQFCRRGFGLAIACGALVGVSKGAVADFIQRWKTIDGGNGHYYELVELDNAVLWTTARDEASARSFRGSVGHLVTVTSAAESDFLKDTFAGYIGDPNTNVPGIYAWIGLFAPTQSAPFQWVTGEAVSYTNWAPPEPNFIGTDLWPYTHVWQRKFTGTDIDPDGTLTWSWNNTSNNGINPAIPSGYFVEYDGPFTSPVPAPPGLVLSASGLLTLLAARGFKRWVRS